MNEVEQKTRRLDALWTVEEIANLKETHQFDIELELFNVLQREIQIEWEKENDMTYAQHDELRLQQLIEVATQFLPASDLEAVRQRQQERENGPDSELIKSVKKIIADSGFTRIQSV